MLAFSESLVFGIGVSKSGQGAAGLREFFSAPYHTVPGSLARMLR
jgi:hypothetical protein